MTFKYRIGVDENGLGARIGPMLVTATLAEVSPQLGAATLKRKLTKGLRADLDDSKRLVSHGNVELGEAWARALSSPDIKTPEELLQSVSLEGVEALQSPCPKSARGQCWSTSHEKFSSSPELVARLRRHLTKLESGGVRLLGVKSSVLCSKVLNDGWRAGQNRFVLDLHAMERLILKLREEAGGEVEAICGKVGGIADYERFFGPLSSRLRVTLEHSRPHSAYRFPGLGNIHFLQDADAKDPLVMLASLVGKYLRELLMDRISAYYLPDAPSTEWPSGYHDPVSSKFFDATESVRARRKIPLNCFERASDSTAGHAAKSRAPSR